jgi:hydroxyacid-oxoacid transhydrogenase
MAYAVAGRVRDYRPPGYPDAPLVPHGFAVAVNAPAVFRRFASTAPRRHLGAAELLGADVRGADERDAGERLGAAVAQLMRAIDSPNGIAGVGYGAADVPALVEGAAPQRRLLDNAPLAVDAAMLGALFHDAMTCW